MNNIIAFVEEIHNNENLNVVKFNLEDIKFTMMSLELNSNIKVGTKVSLGFKASHVAIAKNLKGEVSFSNIILAKIVEIDIGKILASIKLEIKGFIISSIITSQSAKRMNLKQNDEVQVIIKASELYINEVCDD